MARCTTLRCAPSRHRTPCSRTCSAAERRCSRTLEVRALLSLCCPPSSGSLSPLPTVFYRPVYVFPAISLPSSQPILTSSSPHIPSNVRFLIYNLLQCLPPAITNTWGTTPLSNSALSCGSACHLRIFITIPNQFAHSSAQRTWEPALLPAAPFQATFMSFFQLPSRFSPSTSILTSSLESWRLLSAVFPLTH